MKRCNFYDFLKAAQGDWRNSMYLHCDKGACPYGMEPACEGFLLSFNADSLPILVPIEEFRRASGEDLDPTECCAELSLSSFETVCRQHILWNGVDPRRCPAKELSTPLSCNKP